jgi:hypothetical protein
MWPFLIAVAAAIVAIIGGRMADARLVGGRGDARRRLSLALLGAGIWLVTVVHAARWLETPGFYGPIQLWTDDAGNASFLFHVRALAMFVVLVCLIVALAIVVVTASSKRRHENEIVVRRRFLLPGVAMAMFAVACHQFFINGFFPTV